MHFSKLKQGSTLLFVLIFVFSLTACSSNSSGGSSGKKTIKIVYRAPDESLQHMLESSKKEFEKNNDGVQVKISPIETDEGNYPSKKALMLKSKKSAPDIVAEDTYQINSDSQAGYLESLSDRVDKWEDWDEFFDKVKNGVTGNDGKVYGIPISTDTRGLWYNKKVFKKNGLPVPWKPKSWDDVINAAKKIKDDVQVPFWMNSGKAMGEATSMQAFQMLLTGTGDSLYDKSDKKWNVKSDGILNSLKFIHKIYDDDLGASLNWALTGQAGKKIGEQLMPKGEVGISLDGNWVSGTWTKDGPHPWSDWNKVYDFTAMPTENGQGPGHTTMSGGWSLAIPSKASQKDLAWKFLKLTTNKKNLRYGTQLSPRKDISKMKDYNSIPYRKKQTQYLEFTHYRPTFDGRYPSVSSDIQKMVEAVVTGKLTPKKAMDKYAKDVARDIGEDKVQSK